MSTLDKISVVLLLALVVCLPFEFRAFPVLSNLQWLFIAAALTSLPLLMRNMRTLARNRFVIAALVFVSSQWFAALLAGDLKTNAMKAAVRVTAGFVLLLIVVCHARKERCLELWCVASIAAAAYGLCDYFGFGFPHLFRQQEFYVGDVLRLSGSFEYPNTAGAYFALSLPIVWMTPRSRWVRFAGCSLIWIALILTYSRGAAAASAIFVIGRAMWVNRKQAAGLCATGLTLFLVIAGFRPLLLDRLMTVRSGKTVAAEYHLLFNTIQTQPGSLSQSTITMSNVGTERWPASGDAAVSVFYHWYDPVHRRMVDVPVIDTPLEADVWPSQSATITASFQTPRDAGDYLLVWDLKQKGRDWFSIRGVTPAIVQTTITDSAPALSTNSDTSRWYARAVQPSKMDSAISRKDLWRAALGLALQSPLFGVGPDNFRLLYGRPLGVDGWDSNIRANCLYLELLAGSGVIGLGAFASMIAFVGVSFGPAGVALGVFLLHGVVDSFLMTTPIYFGFWMLMGLVHENRV